MLPATGSTIEPIRFEQITNAIVPSMTFPIAGALSGDFVISRSRLRDYLAGSG
jgi:hypothetical protein